MSNKKVRPMWNWDSAGPLLHSSIVPLDVKAYILFYMLGMWPDDMREAFQSMRMFGANNDGSSKAQYPWNLPYSSTNHNIAKWFPASMFPKGPMCNSATIIEAAMLRACYDNLMSGIILRRHLILKRTDDEGLAFYLDEFDMPKSTAMDSLLVDTKALLYKLTLFEYNNLKLYGVDCFYFEEMTRTHYLVYMDVALINHSELSPTSMTNRRNDGHQVKNILEYTFYTRSYVTKSGQELYGLEVTLQISELSRLEDTDYVQNCLQTVYNKTCYSNNLPRQNNATKILSITSSRYPRDGCAMVTNTTKESYSKEIRFGEQIFIDYKLSHVNNSKNIEL